MLMVSRMRLAAKRLVASLTAAVVFSTTVMCVCQGVPLPQGEKGHHRSEQTSGRQPSHERHDHKDHHEREVPPCKHDGSGGHDHACNHCQGLLASACSGAKHFSHLFDFSLFATVSDLNIASSLAFVQSHSRYFFGDLSPPIGPPTLLSLHCALTT